VQILDATAYGESLSPNAAPQAEAASNHNGFRNYDRRQAGTWNQIRSGPQGDATQRGILVASVPPFTTAGKGSKG
jgi:hypothetical protein